MENKLVDYSMLPEPKQHKVKEIIFEELSAEYKQMGIPLEENVVDFIVMSRIENKLFFTQDGFFYYMFDRYKDKL